MALKPFLLGMGPILYKDLVITARRWPTYLWRALGAALIGFFFCDIYFTVFYQMRWRGIQGFADAGAQLVIMAVVVGFVFVGLGVPGAMIRSMVEERERKTLDLLIASPLRPWGIVLGKMVSSLIRGLTVPMVIMPFEIVGISRPVPPFMVVRSSVFGENNSVVL